MYFIKEGIIRAPNNVIIENTIVLKQWIEGYTSHVPVYEILVRAARLGHFWGLCEPVTLKFRKPS